MKLGYPCLNRSIGCKADKTFRLKSYSELKMQETIENNLHCLHRILRFNVDHHLFFFRITSELIPFASHPICTFPWHHVYHDIFKTIGSYITHHQIRISMHPDQFIVLNSPRSEVVQRSIAELQYHADILDMLGLDATAKIQLHVGGVYGDKQQSIQRFAEQYQKLPSAIRKRLVIENDHRNYTLHDCLELHEKIHIPILFDVFHHRLLNHGESLRDAFSLVIPTWQPADGLPMVDYSSQQPGEQKGKHAESLNTGDFVQFIRESSPYDFDLMLEVKDKEKSALKTVEVLKKDKRFYRP